VNGSGILSVTGSLSQGTVGSKSTSFINGKMVIDGEVVVYGNLTINGSGKVEFANSKSKLIVYGSLTNWGSVTNGTITQVK
jgi:cytoskeletal protein CcmA (bactofilin family)